MYFILLYLLHLRDLKEQRDGGRFKVIIWGGSTSHNEGDKFYGEGGSHYVLLVF